MSSQIDSSQSTLTAKEQVYRNVMLRELIIQHFIFNEKNQPAKKHLCMARLVDKTWLACTSKLLIKLMKSVNSPPLLLLEISYDTTDQILCQVHKNGTVSNNNINSFISPNHLYISVLPFSLKITKDCFREQNYLYFCQLLNNWANSLREVYITFPNCGGTMTFTFPMIKFPILDRVTVVWTEEKLKTINGQNQDVFGNNTNSLFFLQYFLNSAPTLSQIVLYIGALTTSDGEYPPKGVEYIHLPPTITCLDLSCLLTGKQLQTIARNPLPCLEKLVIQSDELFREDFVSEALRKFQSSLKYLEIVAVCCGRMVDNSKTFIRLPLLPKVKTLLVNSNDLELEPGQLNLERSLPALETMSILWQTEKMAEKWIDKSKFESVSNFELSIVNLDNNFDDNIDQFKFGDDEDELFIVDIDEILMSRILHAFPNITVLKLHIPCNANDGLHLVFRKMTQIQQLVIYCPWSSINKNPDDWTSTFLGMPIELVVGLKSAPYAWRSLNLQVLSVDGVNIANLTALTSLSLGSYSNNEAINDVNSWISDLVFHLAFLKMPNLTSLTLSGKFKPTNNQIALWERCIPRKISYTQ